MSGLYFASTGDRVAIAFNALQAQLADLSQPLALAGTLTRDAAVRRIKTQGGDTPWVPNKRGGHTGIDTGRMWQSIAIVQQTATEVVVGTNVVYARYFQQGTGIFAGHRPWTIHPVKKRALAFTTADGAQFAAAVTIPGQPSRPFLYIDDRLRTRILRIFGDALKDVANAA